GAAIGIFSAITGISVASGPLVGGAVVQGIDWQWIFWINVPIGLVAIPLVLTKMRESYGPDTGLDLRGLALVTLGALATVWGLVRGNQVGWGSGEVVRSLIAGVVLIVGFVAWERGARPLMVTGLSLQALGMAWLALIADTGMSYTALLGPFIVAGVGVSMAIPAAQNSVVTSVEDHALG